MFINMHDGEYLEMSETVLWKMALVKVMIWCWWWKGLGVYLRSPKHRIIYLFMKSEKSLEGTEVEISKLGFIQPTASGTMNTVYKPAKSPTGKWRNCSWVDHARCRSQQQDHVAERKLAHQLSQTEDPQPQRQRHPNHWSPLHPPHPPDPRVVPEYMMWYWSQQQPYFCRCAEEGPLAQAPRARHQYPMNYAGCNFFNDGEKLTRGCFPRLRILYEYGSWGDENQFMDRSSQPKLQTPPFKFLCTFALM